jgi:CysZ protein
MKLISDFGKGFTNCFRAFSPLFERGLWPYLFYPLLVWVGLWALSFYAAIVLADYIKELIEPYLTVDSLSDVAWIPKFSSILAILLGWLLKFVIWFFGSMFIRYILLMILSPLFAILSESTDEKLSGKKFPFKFSQFIKDIFRGIAITLRNLLMELLISFALWIVTIFFPPLIFITVPLGVIISWYFIGFSILDYNCERYKFSMSKSVTFVKKNKGYAMGIGCVYSIFLALPTPLGTIIGIMFGPTVAVIGATMCFLKITEQEPSPTSWPISGSKDSLDSPQGR